MLYVATEDDLKFLAKMARIKYGYFHNKDGIVQIYYNYPQNNVAAKLLDNLIKSKNKFYFRLIEKAEKECVINKDTSYDRRLDYKGGKSKNDLPPEDFNGYVVIAKNCKFENEGLPVSLEAIVFHELWECYFKVEKQMQYKEAHNMALDMEDLMLKFDKTFTKGSVRGQLKCANCKWHKNNSWVP